LYTPDQQMMQLPHLDFIKRGVPNTKGQDTH
jgi:hypothetical protein